MTDSQKNYVLRLEQAMNHIFMVIFAPEKLGHLAWYFCAFVIGFYAISFTR